MRHPVKLLSFVTLSALFTTVDVAAAQHPPQSPDFTEAAESLTAQVEPTGNVLLEVKGVLEEGDETLNDGSLYDVYPFEGQAGQSITIRLESQDFNTNFNLLLVNSEWQQVSNRDDDAGDTNSQLTAVLPNEGTYLIVVNDLDRRGRGQYQLLITVATDAEERLVEADSLVQQGIQQFNVSLFQEALQSWESALAIYRETGKRTREGLVLGNLGAIYLSLGQYGQAIELFEQQLVIARDFGGRASEGPALNNLGVAYLDLGQYERAIEFAQQRLNIAREFNDRAGEIYALGNLGNAYLNLGQHEQALELYQQILIISRELEDPLGEGEALRGLSHVYEIFGQYGQAIELQQQSLAIAQEIGDRSGESTALGNLGVIYQSLGQYGQAIELQQQSLAIAQEIGDRSGESTALGNLGIAYFYLGQYEYAIELHQGLKQRKLRFTAI